MANRYHWTPEQVDRMDPDYVDELTAYLKASADHHQAEQKRAKHGT